MLTGPLSAGSSFGFELRDANFGSLEVSGVGLKDEGSGRGLFSDSDVSRGTKPQALQPYNFRSLQP